VAEELGVSREAVRSKKYRVLKRLREELAGILGVTNES
jgi:DNA-directed RNA polymerase specialized sigma24 family protein